MLIEADQVLGTPGQARLCLAQQPLHRLRRSLTQPVTQPSAADHAATAGQDRQTGILHSREVEDALDTQHRFERQRQDQAGGRGAAQGPLTKPATSQGL